MKSKIFAAIFSLLSSLLYAQNPTYQWTKSLGSSYTNYALKSNAIKSNAQGFVFVAGKIDGTIDLNPSLGYNFMTDKNAFLAKYDTLGTLIWAKSFGGINGETEIIDLAFEPNGNIVLLGSLKGTVQLDSANSNSVFNQLGTTVDGDLFLAKFDSSLNFIWGKTFQAHFYIPSFQRTEKLQVDSQNNIIVSGAFYDTLDIDPSAVTYNLISTGAANVFVAKFSTTGNFIWAHQLLSNGGTFNGGLAIDNNDNILFLTNVSGSVSYDSSGVLFLSGGRYTAIFKWNAAGVKVWHKVFYSGTSGSTMLGNDITVDNQNRILFTGELDYTYVFQSTPFVTIVGGGFGYSSAFVACLDSNSNYIFGDRITENSNSSAVGQCIKADTQGNIYLTGIASGNNNFDFLNHLQLYNISSSPAYTENYFTASYTSTGVCRWVHLLSETGQSRLCIDAHQNPWMSGSFEKPTTDFNQTTNATQFFNAPDKTTFVKKSSNGGAYILAFPFESSGSVNEWVQDVKSNSSGSVYTVGLYSGKVDFDPSATYNVLEASDTTNGFIASYTSAGALTWVKSINGEVSIKKLRIDSSNNLFLVGYFKGTVDFDPTGVTTNLTSAGMQDIFFAKYDGSGNLIWVYKIGAADDDKAENIEIDSNGNIILTGTFRSSVDFNPSTSATNLLTTAGGTNAFLAKYNSSGGYLWAFKIGGNLHSNNLAIDNNNNIIISGDFYSQTAFNPANTSQLTFPYGGFSSTNVFLAKYDTNGNFQWVIPLKSNQDNGDIAVDASGNIYISGNAGGICDFDPSPSNQVLIDLNVSSTFLAKYSSAGTYIWALKLIPIQSDKLTSLSLDGYGNINLVGTFSFTRDFDPSAAVLNLTSTGNTFDIYQARFSPSGNLLSATNYGGLADEFPYTVNSNPDGTLYIAGYYDGTTNFVPAPGTPNYFINPTGFNGFLMKLTQVPVVQPTCGGLNTLTSCASILEDGSGIQNYGNNQNCSWLISPTGASTITLNFTAFNTESGNDLVKIYNGNSSAAPLIGTYSGSTLPASIISSGSSLFVTFTTNASNVSSGFSATIICNAGPIADFVASSTAIAPGGNTSFTDQSINSPTSWAWTFTGGTPATSSSQNPGNVVYAAAGCYAVTLVVSNTTGSNTLTKTCYITVAVPNPYCIPAPAGGTSEGDFINAVSLGTINTLNTGSTNGASYSNFTNLSTNLAYNTSHTMVIQNGDYFSDTIGVWIDYNNDLDFNDSGEKIIQFETFANNSLFSFNFTVPNSVTAGSKRMRVRISFNTSGIPNMDACSAYEYGETEDYTVVIGTIAPVAAFSANLTTINVGNAVNFIDQSTNTPSSWAWTFPGGTPSSSTLQNPIIIYNSIGTYPVTLVATNSAGSSTLTQATFITVNVGPAPCSELFISEYLEGTGSNKAIELYNPNSTPLNLLDYTLEMYANGATAPSSTFALSGTLAAHDVYVVANSGASAGILAIADATSSVCSFNGNDAIVLKKNGNSIDVIGEIGVNPGTSWSVGSGSTLDNTLVRKLSVTGPSTLWTNSQLEYDAFSVGTISYLGLHTSNCATLPTFPIASFSYTPLSICEGDSVIFTNLSSNANSFIWTFPGGSPVSSTLQNPIVIWTTVSSTYEVSLQAINTAGTDTSIQTVTINPIPTAAIITQLGSQLASSAPSNNQWYLNGAIIPGATSQYYTPIQNGNYSVVVSNAFGCSAVSAPYNLLNVGLQSNEPSKNELRIMPNPFNDFIQLKYNEDFNGKSFILTDKLGQTILMGILDAGSTAVNLSNVANGIYFLNVSGKSFKLVKL